MYISNIREYNPSYSYSEAVFVVQWINVNLNVIFRSIWITFLSTSDYTSVDKFIPLVICVAVVFSVLCFFLFILHFSSPLMPSTCQNPSTLAIAIQMYLVIPFDQFSSFWVQTPHRQQEMHEKNAERKKSIQSRFRRYSIFKSANLDRAINFQVSQTCLNNREYQVDEHTTKCISFELYNNTNNASGLRFVNVWTPTRRQQTSKCIQFIWRFCSALVIFLLCLFFPFNCRHSPIITDSSALTLLICTFFHSGFFFSGSFSFDRLLPASFSSTLTHASIGCIAVNVPMNSVTNAHKNSTLKDKRLHTEADANVN